MPKTERRELRLTQDLAEAIDAARGDVSFNKWAERAFEQALGGDKPRSSSSGPAEARPATPAPTRTAARAPAFNRATTLKR